MYWKLYPPSISFHSGLESERRIDRNRMFRHVFSFLSSSFFYIYIFYVFFWFFWFWTVTSTETQLGDVKWKQNRLKRHQLPENVDNVQTFPSSGFSLSTFIQQSCFFIYLFICTYFIRFIYWLFIYLSLLYSIFYSVCFIYWFLLTLFDFVKILISLEFEHLRSQPCWFTSEKRKNVRSWGISYIATYINLIYNVTDTRYWVQNGSTQARVLVTLKCRFI